MTKFELKDFSGNCFKNSNKVKETQADFTGEIKVDGVVYWLNTWQKTDKNGNPYFSHSLKKKEFKEAKEAVQKTYESEDDNSIPF